MEDIEGKATIEQADAAKIKSDAMQVKASTTVSQINTGLNDIQSKINGIIQRQVTRSPSTPVPKKTPPPRSEKTLPSLETCGIFEPYLQKDAKILEEYITNYNKCLLRNIDYVKNDMDKFMNQHKKNNDKISSVEQINNDTMKTYIKDYYYVILKGIIYLITLAIFIYLFGINNLIEGIKVTGSVIKDKAIILKDKAEEIKNKIVPQA